MLGWWFSDCSLDIGWICHSLQRMSELSMQPKRLFWFDTWKQRLHHRCPRLGAKCSVICSVTCLFPRHPKSDPGWPVSGRRLRKTSIAKMHSVQMTSASDCDFLAYRGRETSHWVLLSAGIVGSVAPKNVNTRPEHLQIYSSTSRMPRVIYCHTRTRTLWYRRPSQSDWFCRWIWLANTK